MNLLWRVTLSLCLIFIICPIHGEFEQTPENHLRGHGCRVCAEKLKAFNQHSNTLNYRTKLFILKSKEIHGNKYDYSKVKYINTHTEVCIICPKHGEFYLKPNNHLKVLNVQNLMEKRTYEII